MNGRAIEILLVEDNPGDARLTIEALKGTRTFSRLTHLSDGAAALMYLRQIGPHAGAPRPDLILLDLNLPRKDGREVLAEIKADEILRRIPVVILTTSQSETDVRQAYDLNANCYVTKPIGLDQFFKVVKCIEEFWLEIVKLPEG
jgi:two-component system, chemotaxis family, response regulator Rcp1